MTLPNHSTKSGAQEITDLPTLVAEAEARIRPHVRRTNLEHSRKFTELTGANVYFKCENLQHTSSFKVRGAMNRFLSLSPVQQQNGVVAASTGNHGKAVAFTANKFGSTATVFVPENSAPSKVAAIKQRGAEVLVRGADCVEAELAARNFARQNDATYVSPYNDPLVVAGQGTIGFELCEQIDQIDAVYASMGGAGLITGIGGYVKSRFPGCQIVGCSPENSKVMVASLEAGRLLDLPSTETLSDGTAGGVEQGSITFDLCQEYVDRSVTVSESEIRDSLRRFVATHEMVIEGAAAVAIASLLKTCKSLQGKNVVVILCGANIGIDKLAQVIQSPSPIEPYP